jgi:hypothetical protein
VVLELEELVQHTHLGNSPKFLSIQLEASEVIQQPQTGKLLEDAGDSVTYAAILLSWSQIPFQQCDLLKLEDNAPGNHSNAITCAHSKHADICAGHLLLQDKFRTD